MSDLDRDDEINELMAARNAKRFRSNTTLRRAREGFAAVTSHSFGQDTLEAVVGNDPDTDRRDLDDHLRNYL